MEKTTNNKSENEFAKQKRNNGSAWKNLVYKVRNMPVFIIDVQIYWKKGIIWKPTVAIKGIIYKNNFNAGNSYWQTYCACVKYKYEDNSRDGVRRIRRGNN